MMTLRPSPARMHLVDRALALLPNVAQALLDQGYGSSGSDRPTGYEIENGIARIPIRGTLANRSHDAWWGEGSYENLRQTFDSALADPACRAILFDIDSPGGECAGAMELAAHVRAGSARKPVVAYVDGMACSAAYAVASGAQEIVVAPSSTIGSVGVVMLHLDYSRMLDAAGVKPTLLHSGAQKVDGNSLKPLGSAAAGRLQGLLDEHYRHFTETVGAHRPKLGAAGARKTEAAIYIGQRAVSAGLVD